MGTEIQGKAYFLGSHRRNDLNESAGGNNMMFIYPDHKTVSQHYDSFLARPASLALDGYLEYHSSSSSSNKEELKKTILKHESIFKQQLEELHRLYRRHMDFMNEIKKRQHQHQKQHFPSQRSLLFSQIPYDDDDLSRKSQVSAISFVDSRDQMDISSQFSSLSRMTSSTMLNFHQGKHAMNIIILGNPAEVEAKMQNERSSTYKGELFLKRTSCELFDLNQPFQEAVFFRPGNSTHLFKSLLVEPSKTGMGGSEQEQKSRIFGVDISKGNYDDQTHEGNNSVSTIFSSPLNKEKNVSNQTEMADTDHNVGGIDQSQKTSTNILGLRHDHIDLNLGLNELEDDIPVPYPKTAEIIDLEKDPECKLTDPNIRKEDEELVRTAAEAIVDISSVVDDQILTFLPCNTLDWFAEIACSDHKEVLLGHVNSTLDDEEEENINPPNGMDYFEFVTLNLTEMKSEEWCYYKKPVLDNHEMNCNEIEEEGLGNRRLRRRRRGGKQRKDFQRDVLPGIVSLSRHEVSDDILAFEELLKTDRRKRPHSNAVERRREEVLLPGWGRTTKRISRLRCRATGKS